MLLLLSVSCPLVGGSTPSETHIRANHAANEASSSKEGPRDSEFRPASEMGPPSQPAGPRRRSFSRPFQAQATFGRAADAKETFEKRLRRDKPSVPKLPPPPTTGVVALVGASVIPAFAPLPSEKKAAETAASDDRTMNGCHCELEWNYKGKTIQGCGEDSLTNPGAKWCKVNQDCLQAQKDDTADRMLWDYCFVDRNPDVTKHGCHCLPKWESEGVEYEGCAKTSHDGAAWCVVLEGHKCHRPRMRSNENGQHWDYCGQVHEEVSPYLTRHGCHCAPLWKHGAGDKVKEYRGCEGPASLSPNGEGRGPWCYVTEEQKLCPESLKAVDSERRYDYCWNLDGATAASELNKTVSGCHCRKAWDDSGGGGTSQRGCASTPTRGSRPWCALAEDERLCPTRAAEGWDFCDGDSASTGEPVRFPYTRAPPIFDSAVLRGGGFSSSVLLVCLVGAAAGFFDSWRFPRL